VVESQLDLFPGDYPIVVPSGSCGGMIRWHWEKVVGDDPALKARAAAIAARTFEFAEFLLHVVAFKRPDEARPPPSRCTPPARPAARWAPCWSAASCSPAWAT
jgi:L-lactate dehydrogenase complex protein LldE